MTSDYGLTFLEIFHRDHPSDPRCDHDREQVVTLGGSWTKVTEEGREKVVCRFCGKFYGYLMGARREAK